MNFKRVLDVACVLLLTSSIMDSYLWIANQYHVPCWTIAVMSTGFILLLQVLKRLI